MSDNLAYVISQTPPHVIQNSGRLIRPKVQLKDESSQQRKN